MLHRLGAHVNQLRVGEVAREQVVQRLGTMAGHDAFPRLELEQPGGVQQHIQEVSLAEGFVEEVDGRFETDASHASGQLALVDLLIKETAQVVVHLEDVPHHLERHRAELFLGDAPQGNARDDGHA